MTRYPWYDDAAAFLYHCTQWAPVDQRGEPSIWELKDSLGPMKDAIYMFTNGYIKYVSQAQRTLEGGLHPGMQAVMADLWDGLAKAATNAELLEGTFVSVYAEAEARRATRGRKAENV